MRSFEFERWDDGRLLVNREFADLFRANGLTTFDALMHFQGGTVAKNLLRERTTTRFSLPPKPVGSNPRETHLYIKRHGPAPWKEYIKPWLRFRRPILGARNEWEAILRFHEAGIPTMLPVALGESGPFSFLVTQALEGCRKLSDELRHRVGDEMPEARRALRRLLNDVAGLARRMHAAGMHHQDFYLGHVLVEADRPDRMYLIDLGRVRRRQRLARHWIVKDLGQLNYSALFLSRSERLRLFKAYLGRELQSGDRRLWQRIEGKSAAIARHSRKNGL